MIDIETMVKEIQKKRHYDKISSDEIKKYISRLATGFNIEDSSRLKREIIIALDKIDSTLWEVKDSDEYILDKKLNKYVDKLIEDENYIALTIPVQDLKIIADNKLDYNEYFEYRSIFKQKDLPESNVISLLQLPKSIRTRIINNIDEPTFENIVRNNYCNLYTDISKKQNMSMADKTNFVRIIKLNNSVLQSTPYNDDFEKDRFHVETLDDLKNIEDMKSDKIEDLMDEKYSVYDIKREFCNRFMNIDPIILENIFYNPNP